MNPLPDFKLAVDDRLPLGAYVRYSHLAAVARWSKLPGINERSSWNLTEGVQRGWHPAFTPAEESKILNVEFGFDSDPFYDRPIHGTNKTVFVWPQEGTANITGLVSRGIGESFAASGGHGMFGDDDYEPGGFHSDGFVWLYTLRTQLVGRAYLLAPAWAVEAV